MVKGSWWATLWFFALPAILPPPYHVDMSNLLLQVAIGDPPPFRTANSYEITLLSRPSSTVMDVLQRFDANHRTCSCGLSGLHPSGTLGYSLSERLREMHALP